MSAAVASSAALAATGPPRTYMNQVPAAHSASTPKTPRVLELICFFGSLLTKVVSPWSSDSASSCCGSDDSDFSDSCPVIKLMTTSPSDFRLPIFDRLSQTLLLTDATQSAIGNRQSAIPI